MKDCKDLKINSYLSPHPLDEDSDMDDEFVSWIPGFLDEPDEEQGLTAYLRDENIELYKNIEQSVSNVIRAAFESMWPLLDKHIFKSIQVAIELISFGPNSTALAGYSYSYSAPEKGVYVFHVDQKLLYRYSTHLKDGVDLICPGYNIWEHEIVHLLDHWQIVKASTYKESNVVSENLKYYLLKFREEGIANLFDLLSGEIKKFNSIEEARNMFVSHYKETLQKTKSITESNHELRQDVYSGYIYYEVGPWLILEILKTFECGFHNDLVERCIQSIINDEPINHDDKLEIIRTALRIEVENFLDYAKELLQPKSILC